MPAIVTRLFMPVAGVFALLMVAAGAPARPSSKHPTLVDTESTQCASCHGNLIKGRSGIHPPAADDCTTCHVFSQGDEGLGVSLVESEPGLCVMCHDEMERAVAFELETPHYPAGDSCLTCHDPHASDTSPLLMASVTELCSGCHDMEDLNSVHGKQLTAATDCSSCHQPHGSNNERMLRATHLHVPFADGSCSGCHREPSGERIRLRLRGARLCEACHGEFPQTASGSVHAALEDDQRRAGCLSCHSPHMSDQRAVLLKAEPDLCAECHGEIVAGAQADTGHFAAADSCLNCHSPHTADEANLLVQPAGGLCGECHDLEPRPAVVAAPALELEGMGHFDYGPAPVVSAADFDNGTDDPGMCTAPFPAGTWGGEIVLCQRGEVKRVLKGENVRAGGAGGLILANRQGRAADLFADAHTLPAVHISAADAERVQVWLGFEADQHRARIAGSRLVLESSAPSKPVGGDLVATHLGADLERLDCVGCHSPHGAGHPRLLAEHLHPPVEDGCDTCHEGSYNQLLEGGAPDLCLMCHDDVAEAAAAAAVPHGALEVGSCTDCHNPHASSQEKLVRAPGVGPCADCHDEQTAGFGEVEHGVIELIGCHACHEPHGGANDKMLRTSPSELCLACHSSGGPTMDEGEGAILLLDRFLVETEALRGGGLSILQLSADGRHDHPVTNHRVLGASTPDELKLVDTSFKDEFTCLTCHDPHKGRSAQLFRWNAELPFEVCKECHDK